MAKSEVTDNLELLTRRFEDLIEKVRNIMEELGDADGDSQESQSSRAYTVSPSPETPPSEARSRALIRVVEQTLKGLDSAMDSPSSGLQKHKPSKLFTVEELHFLEQTMTSYISKETKASLS